VRSDWAGLQVKRVEAFALVHGCLVALALACGDNIDASGEAHGLRDQLTEWLTSEGALHGAVYRCESGAMCLSPYGEPATEEWCWEGEEFELEAHLGVGPDGCWPVDDRWWPRIAGCAYACPLEGPGSNAHCGAFCPSEAP
jgi:hypothetical protein